MYADDIALTAESAADLQRMLGALHAYCRRWQLFVNVAKTEVVVFRRSGQVTDTFAYNDQKLPVVESFRYLGVTFRSDGKLDDAIKTRVAAANRVFYKHTCNTPCIFFFFLIVSLGNCALALTTKFHSGKK